MTAARLVFAVKRTIGVFACLPLRGQPRHGLQPFAAAAFTSFPFNPHAIHADTWCTDATGRSLRRPDYSQRRDSKRSQTSSGYCEAPATANGSARP